MLNLQFNIVGIIAFQEGMGCVFNLVLSLLVLALESFWVYMVNETVDIESDKVLDSNKKL